jgi:hypothetical protein
MWKSSQRYLEHCLYFDFPVCLLLWLKKNRGKDVLICPRISESSKHFLIYWSNNHFCQITGYNIVTVINLWSSYCFTVRNHLCWDQSSIHSLLHSITLTPLEFCLTVLYCLHPSTRLQIALNWKMTHWHIVSPCTFFMGMAPIRKVQGRFVDDICLPYQLTCFPDIPDGTRGTRSSIVG